MNTLHEAVEDYVAMRRALGFKLKEAGKGLVDFAGFLQREHAAYITVPLALKWAQKTSSIRPAEWARRLNFIRGFARYHCATDPRTEIPPWGLLPFHPQRARPYLYTDAEIRSLLTAALQWSPDDALRRWTYHVLLGLLAVSGMRISETLELRLSDVDLQNGVLTVRGTKFGQSRLVPLHPSTNDIALAVTAISADATLRIISLSPNEATGWMAQKLDEHSIRYRDKPACAARPTVIGREYTIFVTASRYRR